MVLGLSWSPSTTNATRILRSRPVRLLLLYPCLRGLEAAAERHSSVFSFTPLSYALVEVLKSVYAFFTLRYRRPSTPYRRPHHGQEEEEYFLGEHDGTRGSGASARTYWPIAVCAGLLWAAHSHLYATAVNEGVSAITLQVALASATLFVLLGQYLLFSKSGLNASGQTVALQLAGVLIAGSTLAPTPSTTLLVIPVSIAMTMLSYELCYQSYSDISPTHINIVSFVSATVAHIAFAVYTRVAPRDLADHLIGVSAWDLLLIPLRTASGLWALSIVHDFGSLAEGMCRSLAFVFTLFGRHTLSIESWLGLIGGTLVNTWSGFTYLANEIGLQIDQAESPGYKRKLESVAPSNLRRVLSAVLALALGALCFVFPLSDTASLSSVDTQCANGRRSPSVPALPDRKYHHFDDTLLIVFFSHARYDVNLDHYREVYAEYFPNMVFVGPKTREDAGFRHSYDVLVDSYQSDEDLRDDKNFKMAGRMAHHMLYTAMQEYPCYDGYLWAPFDTFLNIPRLEQFDLNTFWYHSPFAKYVPNKALGTEEENQDPKRHPPPANISPDPKLNLTDGWRGWGDWWWGDPHVGIAECMPAFLRTPEIQRLRLAAYLDGETRFIGGSVDTLYIPGRHYERLMHTLGLFLETNCFLEIALPTVLHLVVPFDEEILYVDHHWIWYPPFNGDFVRQQWREGFEVDTFHTFHWGDTQEDGVWRGDPNLVGDTRDLLRQSAARQGTVLP
ncbi:unnamed protein product [Peniophora sp. CBMAI 1063]|nr:unnamed protein product [Peniophora sp. CBMAI 1063]